MPANLRSTLDDAIAWHIKSSSMNEAQWAEFVAWLEGSVENRFEYDRVATTDALISQLPIEQRRLTTDRLDAQPRRRRNFAPAGAAAALLVAALMGMRIAPSSVSSRVEQTSAGTVKQIAFANGNRLDLNGETRLLLDPSDPRAVSLEKGEVLFAVKHSPQPFTVEAGGFKMQDLGTIFNVRMSDSVLELAVKDGSVLFDPDGTRLEIKAGESITVDRARNLVVKGQSSAVGGWVNGELSFEDSNLAAVVAAMHRRSGIEIRLTPALSSTPFTGNIKLSGNGAADAVHLARLIGANYTSEGDVWILSPGRGSR